MQMRNIRRNSRNNLRRAGTAANNGDALVCVIVTVVPLVGVEGFAGKGIAPRKRRNNGSAEWPGGINHKLSLQQALAVGVNIPALLAGIPFNFQNIGAGKG